MYYIYMISIQCIHGGAVLHSKTQYYLSDLKYFDLFTVYFDLTVALFRYFYHLE